MPTQEEILNSYAKANAGADDATNDDGSLTNSGIVRLLRIQGGASAIGEAIRTRLAISRLLMECSIR